MIKQKKASVSKTIKRKITRCVMHIKATFNNTIISISDINGNVIVWSSAGSSGFKGSRKSTPFASQVASEFAIKRAMDQGMKQLEINVSGTGSGRDSAIRAVQGFGLSITVIRDITSIPHNGCRPKKKRRV
uniref:Small ribosomal subunit protein uS11c n=1 Tax=Phacus inflexus TaxID=461210 RepID=A0A3G3LKS3_9EUGL|nr:ribosomal protein S11 [Phacus inflexus]AYQ93313.1 ribosomal protein S11 [Phacus inflexus]